jgi:translocation and assembly module TamB
MAEAETPAKQPPLARRLVLGGLRLLTMALLGLAVVVALGLLVLDSPLGHRLVADRVAALKVESGLVIHIGRIDGSLFGAAQLHDVVLADPAGRFLTVPDVDLDWRPLPTLRMVLGWGGGLDIRTLALHRGLLWRAPQLNPGNPNEPILPDFDIRIDRFQVDGLAVAPGLAGAKRRIDLTARAHVHRGHVVVSCDGKLGGHDRLSLHLDSEPDRDTFALSLDYNAPRDGLLAALSGVRHDIAAKIGGAGRFTAWHGTLTADADGKRLATGKLDNHAGHYDLAMTVDPRAAAGGLPAELGGDRVDLTFAGTFANSRIDGRYHAANALAQLDGRGAIDLAHNRAQGLALTVRLVRPDLLPATWRDLARPGQGTLVAQLDGPFRDLAITHTLTLTRLDTDPVKFYGLRTSGVAHWHQGRLDVPLALTVARVDTDTPWVDRHLDGAHLTGGLRIDRTSMSGDNWRVSGRGITGNLALKGDLRHVTFALAGRVDVHGVPVPHIGDVTATAKGVVLAGKGMPWTLAANYAGDAGNFSNAGLRNFAGSRAHVAGSLHWGKRIPLLLNTIRVTSDRLSMTGNGRYGPSGHLELVGQGHHTQYGAFDAHGTIDRKAGTSAEAHFANPLPAAGVKDLALTLNSTPGGYRLVAHGASRLGPIAGTLDIAVPADDGPMRLALGDTRVFDTQLTGTLVNDAMGLDGTLTLTGGGLDGTIDFAGKAEGQQVAVTLNAHAAKFGDDRPITIALAKLTGTMLAGKDSTTLNASLQAQGIAASGLFVGRLMADATMVDGSGSVTASLAGRRGTRFELQGTAAFTPDKVIAFMAGDYAGTPITMPRRAILVHDGSGEQPGWRLEPSQISFGSGAVIASGRFGGGGASEVHLAVSRMPLSALDIVYADLGLGGYASGVIDYRNDHTGAPAGHAALTVMGLTRSGLVLTSRPMDLALVGTLDASALQVRAVAREGKIPRMRLQALIADMPRGGAMMDRLRAGRLSGQLRYAGPADALWRLAAVDAFDLTGPIGIAADVSGTLDTPVLAGAVASHTLRAQSTISGSDIQNIDLSGTFSASHLSLAHFTGTTPNGGHVAGSGSIDFSDVSSERPRIDLRLGATNAELVNRPEMGATITGPMRIVSDGHSGTVAGRLRIDRARWVLGRTTAAQGLPTIAVTERNAPADIAPPPVKGLPWKLLIDASGANRIDVHGMGLESEWQTDVRLRGDTTNPQIFGSADLIRGSYEFAGKRFDLSRGRIRFNGEQPIDPQLDIVATGDANDVSATISIGGSALKPQITFTSSPSLPEEELLSRILFGSSISQISAPEAVQLASALAALRGGGGMDPINKLRGAIGLDRLRVLSADASIGRGTAIAVGKYLGRKFYIELVTDGHGYSATSIEFRLTRWLSLLGTVSTMYDESIELKYTKDY